MQSMVSYSKAAMERAMKVQEAILRAIAKKITWWQAAEIIGISDRHMRRWRERSYQRSSWNQRCRLPSMWTTGNGLRLFRSLSPQSRGSRAVSGLRG